MKKLLSVYVAVMILCSSLSLGLSAFAAGGEYLVQSSSGATLYANKQISSEKLAVLRRGTIVTALEESDGFIRVSYEGYSGWLLLAELVKYEPADASVSRIEVTKLPNKTVYYEADKYWKEEPFDPAGLKVTAYDAQGNSMGVITPSIYAPVMTRPGTPTVTVAYKGHYATFAITVRKHPIERLMITPPATLTYKEGSPLDLTGLSATVYYTDAAWAPRVLALDDLIISGYDKDAPGLQTVKVGYKYEGVNASFEVEVIPKILERIEVTTPPTQLNYYGTNRTLNLTGMVVTAFYDNGASKTLTGASCAAEWVETAPAYDKKTQIRVSYTEDGVTKSALYDVMLYERKAVALRVEGPTTKTYLKGSALDTTGLSLYLEYNSGEKEYITKNFTMAQPDMSIAGPHTVVVTYGEFTASFLIEVWSTNLYGDVDFDLKITAADARQVLRASAKLETLTAEQTIVGNFGVVSAGVTAANARTVLRMSARLEAKKYIFEN
ncbi:MAG: bacterial Ig-like domain-containing protein [Oscillospiraceae bacterium]|nr:bacterial Ig-like domain-containing protein [Oscillospiraceae bacterium]